MYPPGTSDLQTYSAPFKFLNNLSFPTDYQYAINSATADVGLAVPDAPAGNLNTSLDLVAYTIALDLALYYLRWRFEREPDTGAMPAELNTIHDQIQNRLDLLAENTEKQIGLMAMEEMHVTTHLELPSLPPCGYVGGIRSSRDRGDWNND